MTARKLVVDEITFKKIELAIEELQKKVGDGENARHGLNEKIVTLQEAVKTLRYFT